MNATISTKYISISPVVTLIYKTILMSSSIKQELIKKISSTDNEDLLNILKADYDYFIEGDKDVLDELSDKDREELTNMLNEPFGYETGSYEDFKNATHKWRTK